MCLVASKIFDFGQANIYVNEFCFVSFRFSFSFLLYFFLQLFFFINTNDSHAQV